MMRQAGPGIGGDRVRGLIVVLWRAGLRIGEALDLAEADLDPGRGALLVRRGKGGKRREAGMDDWGWQQLSPWLAHRTQLPPGPLFCVIYGVTPRQALGRERCPRRPPPPRRPSRRAAPLCASPAAPCPRHRDGPRRRRPEHHSTPARAHRPRRHLHLPSRHRQHRNHQHHPRPPTTHDAGERRAQARTPDTRSSRPHAAYLTEMVDSSGFLVSGRRASAPCRTELHQQPTEVPPSLLRRSCRR